MNNFEVETERSADELDVASQAMAVAAAVAREEAKRRVMPESTREVDGSITTQGKDEQGKWKIPDCVICGEENAIGRMELGRIRCINCQTRIEKRLGGY